MGFVMYDKDEMMKEINRKTVFFSDKPEKIYDDSVEDYGDRRDFWRKFDSFESARLAVDFCESRGAVQGSEQWKHYSDAFITATDVCKKHILNILCSYEIPTGNSSAGELACEWTYEAIKAIHAEIVATT